MEKRLQGKVALVTGSGGLIGPVIVRRLAKEGAAVAVTDLSLESAGKLSAEISGDLRGNCLSDRRLSTLKVSTPERIPGIAGGSTMRNTVRSFPAPSPKLPSR